MFFKKAIQDDKIWMAKTRDKILNLTISQQNEIDTILSSLTGWKIFKDFFN